MPATLPCPGADDYRRLTRGEADPGRGEELLAHLERCDGCARVVAGLPEPDTLADLLRGGTVADAPAAVVGRIVDRLARLRPDPPPDEAGTRDWGEPRAYDWLAPGADGELGALGPYRVLGVLGSGGMGVVFRARDPHLDRPVALKAMLPALAARPAARERFLREARATAAIRHDHIVTVHQVGEDRGVPFLAMELLDGETLDARLEREGKLGPAEAARVGREVALGLAAAHARGLVHRDVKPANVWLEAPAGRVKLLDFGLVHSPGDADRLTLHGAVLGTPAYMAPEQAQALAVDHRADLFGLGCLLYRALTGKPAFRGPDTVGTLLAVSTFDPPAPHALDPAVPPALSGLVMGLLAKNPADRPASARAVADALEQVGAPRARRRRRKLLVGFGAAALAAVASALLAGAVVRVGTKDGVIVLEDLPRDAVVQVDGEVVRVQDGPGGKWVEVRVAPGQRKLVVKAAGFVATTEDITLGSGERKPIRVRLEPTALAPAPAAPGSGWAGWPADAPPGAVAPFDAARARKHQEAWAAYLGVPAEWTNAAGMRFRLVPPGEFTIGSTPAEIAAATPLVRTDYDAARPTRVASEGPQRRVTLTRPFYMGVHEVTQRQYEKATGEQPSSFTPTGPGRSQVPAGTDTADQPVERVTWNAATAFLSALSRADGLRPAYRATALGVVFDVADGYRLPTEAEWEFACRAGTTTLFWTGDDEPSLGTACWYGPNNGPNIPKPVGKKRANPFGLHDTHGNVWEWVHDEWDPRSYESLTGPAATDPRSDGVPGGVRVIRGGDYFMPAAEVRSACRDGYHATDVFDDVGFRAALPVDAVRKLRAKPPGGDR